MLELLDALITAETLFGEFAKLCSRKWKEDDAFWNSLIMQQKRHSEIVGSIKQLVVSDKHRFFIKRSLTFKAVGIFINHIKSVLDKIRNAEITYLNSLYAARSFEDTLISYKYWDLFESTSLEFQSLAKTLFDEKAAHRIRIQQKIDLVKEKNTQSLDLLTIYEQKNNPEIYLKAEAILDPFEKAIRDHHDLQEAKEYLALIPEKINSGKVWRDLHKIEVFFDKYMRQHFIFEENLIFPKVITKQNCAKTQETVKTLIDEHAKMLSVVEKIENFLFVNVYPLSSEKIDTLNKLIGIFITDFKDHALIEETEIFPCIKNSNTVK